MWKEGCTNYALPDLSVHVRPARSILRSALNFRCYAIAALVPSPCRYWPLRSPGGPPLPFAPPFNRQRPFFVAGDRQGFPLLVRAPAVGDFAASALSGAEPVETLLLLVAER